MLPLLLGHSTSKLVSSTIQAGAELRMIHAKLELNRHNMATCIIISLGASLLETTT